MCLSSIQQSLYLIPLLLFLIYIEKLVKNRNYKRGFTILLWRDYNKDLKERLP